MYENLANELKRKGISVTAAAKMAEMPEPTFRSKLNGRSECGFTVDEAMSIKFNIFPEMDFIYLFTKSDKPNENCA
ncbi:MAG: DNA-binding protein [Oscillospiraceae bacterium]|nr:DNA-binding protein [Oscillospiraceae bacterium]